MVKKSLKAKGIRKSVISVISVNPCNRGVGEKVLVEKLEPAS